MCGEHIKGSECKKSVQSCPKQHIYAVLRLGIVGRGGGTLEKHLPCLCDQITAPSLEREPWVHTVFILLRKHKAKLIGIGSGCVQAGKTSADPSQDKIRWIKVSELLHGSKFHVRFSFCTAKVDLRKRASGRSCLLLSVVCITLKRGSQNFKGCRNCKLH